jgi:CRP-like cAMP-binding protein
VEQVQVRDMGALLRKCRQEWGERTFLARMNPEDLHTLAEAGIVVRLSRGEDLVVEGERETDVYLLLSSTVEVTARSREDERALLAVRAAGDVIGELAALESMARTATVSVRGQFPALAIRIEGGVFLEALRSLPSAAVLLAATVARKLGVATRRRIAYTGQPACVRLAGVIAEMAQDYGVRDRHGSPRMVIGVNLTQKEWGALIGVSESTAYRGFRVLKKQRLISVGYANLAVPDVAKLRAFAYPGHLAGPDNPFI